MSDHHARLLRALAADTLSVGQAAELSGLSVKAILGAADSGAVRSFLVPMSRHRRVVATSLRDFLRESHAPTIAIDIGLHVVANPVRAAEAVA